MCISYVCVDDTDEENGFLHDGALIIELTVTYDEEPVTEKDKITVYVCIDLLLLTTDVQCW